MRRRKHTYINTFNKAKHSLAADTASPEITHRLGQELHRRPQRRMRLRKPLEQDFAWTSRELKLVYYVHWVMRAEPQRINHGALRCECGWSYAVNVSKAGGPIRIPATLV